jgi:sulfatase maturation enzyme AslB (radical SAM superfamily)
MTRPNNSPSRNYKLKPKIEYRRYSVGALKFPFIKNIGLMLTYKCTTACPHCIVRAGPSRTEEALIENAVNWVEQSAKYRNGHIKGLALTGGEPFYNIELLRKISEIGAKLGMVVSAVSNAFWATSKTAAVQMLSSLPGIRMISISTDVYHQKTISFEHVINAIEAAEECGLLYSVAVCTDHFDDIEYKKTLDKLSRIIDEDKIRISIAFPVGRAQKLINVLNYNTSSEPCAAACTMGSSPIIFPDGNIFACIGPLLTLKNKHPLLLGNVHEEPLEVILDRAESNLLLHAIRIWGPGKLVKTLEKEGYSDILPDEYISDCVCDACYKLMSNDRILDCLMNISTDIDFVEKVAYGRVFFLNESTMAKKFIADGIIAAEQ